MIPYFIPDMPSTAQLIPFLEEIDDNNWYTNFGPLYNRFKQRIANSWLNGVDDNRITLVSSGTSAISLALKTLNLETNSNILTTGFTFPATIHAIKNAGLTPVICDIDSKDWQLSPDTAKNYIKQHNIAAIVPVAAFGVPVNSEHWANFSAETGIPVVVDAAPALMSQDINDNLIYAFSLHATKPLGIGEGGLVLFPKPNQAKKCKQLSNFGIEPNRNISLIGTNAKLSEYHCAVGIAQLERIKQINEKRDQIFVHYKSKLSELTSLRPLQKGTDKNTPASLYVVFDDLVSSSVCERLFEKGIETRLLYQPVISELSAYKGNITIASKDLKNLKDIAKHGLALPFHTHLSNNDINYVVETISNIS